MSLSSTELNFLVWRYLQESGAELAAFALEKHSKCRGSSLEKSVAPGTLVSLVQRGILYSIAQSDVIDESLNARLCDTEPNLGPFLEMAAASLQEALLASNSDEKQDPVAETSAPADEESKKVLTLETPPTASTNFTTTTITPATFFDPSVSCSWHPKSDVFAYGTNNSSLVVNAMRDSQIAELVTISHPLSSAPYLVNVLALAWSPQGNTIVSATADGDLRAWAPDGTLRNVASVGHVPVTRLLWSPEGTYLLAVDANASTIIFDGTTLAVVKNVGSVDQGPLPADASWLSDNSLAVSSTTGSIYVYSISGDGGVLPAVELTGHALPVTLLAYDPQSRLLSSCADNENRIFIWTRHLTKPVRELTIGSLPIVALVWIAPSILVSVQIDAYVSVWDAESGQQLGHTNLFREKRNFNIQDLATPELPPNVQAFDAVLSPNKRLLAVADERARVTVWDVDWTLYASSTTFDTIRCVGIFDPGHEAALDPSLPGSFGICDMAWDSQSLAVCVSYTGAKSAIFMVDTKEEDVEMNTE